MVEHYINPTNLKILYSGFEDSIPDSLTEYALSLTDTWIDSNVEGLDKFNPPSLISRAAEFKALAFIYNHLTYTSDSEISPVHWYESEAQKYLELYITDKHSHTTDPYSHSHTPYISQF